MKINEEEFIRKNVEQKLENMQEETKDVLRKIYYKKDEYDPQSYLLSALLKVMGDATTKECLSICIHDLRVKGFVSLSDCGPVNEPEYRITQLGRSCVEYMDEMSKQN